MGKQSPRNADLNSQGQDTPSPEEQNALASTRVMSNLAHPESSQRTRSEEDTAIVQANLTVVGDYRLTRKIGEGAMGAVYLARQLSFDRDVALKILFPHVAANPKLVERLYREGRVLGQLDHPHIVQAFGIGEDQGFHYVAMEYVDGHSLQKWLDRLGRIGLPDALHVTLEVARALEYAHNLGLVHRDIKPDNILINKQGVIKIADLGMVKTADEDMSLTQTGHAVGTPWYMPLEQARNAKETDGRCDIYALGCVLYCMLTGNPPFTGRTIVDVIQAKEAGTFPPARSANPDVPERLDLIIAKMTAKHPKYRYQTCTELIQDLSRLGLATESPTFLNQKQPQGETKAEAAPAVETPIEIDPDLWFVRIKHGDGTSTVTRFRTHEVRKMLTEGSLKPTARASHHPEESFRALATYHEFHGAALSKVSRQAADQQGSRFRMLMKKIEDNDRAREEQGKVKKRGPLASYWYSLWLPSIGVAAAILAVYFLWHLITGRGR